MTIIRLLAPALRRALAQSVAEQVQPAADARMSAERSRHQQLIKLVQKVSEGIRADIASAAANGGTHVVVHVPHEAHAPVAGGLELLGYEVRETKCTNEGVVLDIDWAGGDRCSEDTVGSEDTVAL